MSCESCELAKRCDALQDQSDELRTKVAKQELWLAEHRGFVEKVRDALEIGEDKELAFFLMEEALQELDKSVNGAAP